MSSTLSKSDVSRLLHDPSAEARAETAVKVACQFTLDTLSPAERAIAEDIFRVLVRDAEIRVREALAQHVKEAEALPHDVAMALARDEDVVATPFLECSQVLSDEDLIEIIRSFGPAKQQAIARRPVVSAQVSDVLVDTRNEDVVATLVENQGADISEPSLHKVLARWGENERFHEPLVRRERLPVTIAERLVSLVSERLQDHLVAHHALPADVADRLALQSRERATIGLISPTDGTDAVDMLARHLKANGRLTPTLMLRALCMGDMAFFEAAMAELSEVPLVNARVLIHDSGPLGLKGIYEKAKLPPSLYRAFRIAVDVAHETEYDGEPHDQERHSRRMIERILTQYEDVSNDNLEYLLSRLAALPSATENRPAS